MMTNWRTWTRYGVWLLVVGAVIVAFIIGRATVRKEHTGLEAPLTSVGGEPVAAKPSSTPQEYTCSMHPQVRSPNPNDKCPICGMDLIPVPSDADDGDADAPVLWLSPRAAALMQVEVWPAERREVHHEVRLFGRLDYDETRLRTIAARYPGRLDRLHVNFTGTSVAQNELLADIYSPALIAAQEELFQAIRARERISPDNRIARDTAQATLEASRDRLRLLGLTPVQIDEIETRRTLADHLTIHSPMDGVVTQRHVTEGEYVETGQPIYSIADLSNLWVNMEVYESDLAWLRVGDLAAFTAQTFPGEEFNGMVSFVDPLVDAQKRTVRVRVDVPNDDGRLKPGMFVRGAVHASVHGHHAESPLVVPATAPLITGRRAVVYVQVPHEERLVFEGRQVTLGPRAGGYYVVQDGLQEGDLVVVHGAFRLDSELQIRGRPSMMQPEGGRPPMIHDHGDHAAARLPTREAVDAPAAFRASLTPLYDAYVDLQVALADDEIERSREAAKRLHAAVGAIDAGELRGEARDLWRVLAARLHTDHQHIDHFDIDALRERFKTWSNATIELSDRFGYGGGRDLVVAWCPMAFDDAGAHWLQVGHAIANPYFGAMMFRCGDVVRHVGEHVEEEQATEDKPAPAEASPQFLAALDSIYPAYFELQNALAADDLNRSRTAAARFHEKVTEIDDDRARANWNDLRERLLSEADQVAGVDDIEQLREIFESWAMAMIDLSKTYRHPAASGHFVAHCPMAFEWRGASWLQADDRINNPYFGATMLRCGTIRERIEPRAAEGGGDE